MYPRPEPVEGRRFADYLHASIGSATIKRARSRIRPVLDVASGRKSLNAACIRAQGFPWRQINIDDRATRVNINHPIVGQPLQNELPSSASGWG